MEITLCMIVRNEEKLLADAIKSAKRVMGIKDIVVVDTGSTDKTKEIAQQCKARVFDFEWCDDFSAAQNFAAQHAKNDWILKLDADEEIKEASMDKTAQLLDTENTIGVVTMMELSDDTLHNLTRIYNRKTHEFSGAIHENITPIPQRGKRKAKSKRVQVPIHFTHRGYLPELQEERKKFERNVRMLEGALRENPNDPYYLYHLGKCNFNFQRDLEKACECFGKVLSLCDEVQLEYIYTTVECYGYALINTERYREALNLVEVYNPHYRHKPEFRFLAAHIYQNNGLFVEAVECYESCIGAEFRDAKGAAIASYLSFYNIGVILECMEMLEDAISVYKLCGDYEPALARLRELE